MRWLACALSRSLSLRGARPSLRACLTSLSYTARRASACSGVYSLCLPRRVFLFTSIMAGACGYSGSAVAPLIDGMAGLFSFTVLALRKARSDAISFSRSTSSSSLLFSRSSTQMSLFTRINASELSRYDQYGVFAVNRGFTNPGAAATVTAKKFDQPTGDLSRLITCGVVASQARVFLRL